MIILNLFYILMPLSIILAFVWAPPAEFLGEASRILYFHVPVAWISTLAFFVSGILSIVYLYDKDKKYKLTEEKAFNSAVLGMIFIVLATVIGAVWSKISWGAYWNWDPRQISIVVLMLIYLAYFSLRSALAENANRGRLTSAYLIIAMVTVPFLVFVIPRVYASLHPDPIINSGNKMQLDNSMKITLLLSLISFTMLYFYLLSVANRVSGIHQKLKEKSDD
jgi:heme exporter protein C